MRGPNPRELAGSRPAGTRQPEPFCNSGLSTGTTASASWLFRTHSPPRNFAGTYVRRRDAARHDRPGNGLSKMLQSGRFAFKRALLEHMEVRIGSGVEASP
jgi:hypothetical protein